MDMRKAVDSDFWHLDKLGSLVGLLRSNLIDYNKFWTLKYDSFLECRRSTLARAGFR